MKILAATDGTKQSSGVINAVATLNLAPGSEVFVVTVVDMGLANAVDLYSGQLPDAAEAEKHARQHAAEVLDENCAAMVKAIGNSDIKVTPVTLFGSPDSRIVEFAEESGVNMIIVGSHGYNRWERLLLGSVSDSIVHHAPCSVLVVRN